MTAFRINRLGDFRDAVEGNFQHKDFTTKRVFEREKDHFNTLLKRDVESGQFGVRYRQNS